MNTVRGASFNLRNVIRISKRPRGKGVLFYRVPRAKASIFPRSQKEEFIKPLDFSDTVKCLDYRQTFAISMSGRFISLMQFVY